jgi:endonuclease III
MQSTLFRSPQDDLHTIRDRLRARSGRIRDEQRLDPTSQFVHAIIGSRTRDEVSDPAFWRLVAQFRSWDAIADAPVGEIEAVLADVTYPERKAETLTRALKQIRARVGSIDLEFLAHDPVDTALFGLEQMDDVGRKISAATLNFSTLRMRAFVVDTHVERVLKRFGFVDPHADSIAIFDAVMAAADGFDADDLYELHWLIKRLGQTSCSHFVAFCTDCPLSEICLKRVETGPALGRGSRTGSKVRDAASLRSAPVAGAEVDPTVGR